jgi:hypothetical protein
MRAHWFSPTALCPTMPPSLRWLNCVPNMLLLLYLLHHLLHPPLLRVTCRLRRSRSDPILKIRPLLSIPSASPTIHHLRLKFIPHLLPVLHSPCRRRPLSWRPSPRLSHRRAAKRNARITLPRHPLVPPSPPLSPLPIHHLPIRLQQHLVVVVVVVVRRLVRRRSRRSARRPTPRLSPRSTPRRAIFAANS